MGTDKELSDLLDFSMVSVPLLSLGPRLPFPVPPALLLPIPSASSTYTYCPVPELQTGLPASWTYFLSAPPPPGPLLFHLHQGPSWNGQFSPRERAHSISSCLSGTHPPCLLLQEALLGVK